jgi:serine/threonine protein kinase
MKYYEKGSLREQINKGNFTKRRYEIAKQICDGLKEIHKLNYVHSDLKCSNILVEDDRSVFISDFGAARLRGSKPIACTPGFCPKDFFSKPLCFEDDMFSLGKLFIEYFARIDEYKIKDINAWNFS